MSTVHKPMSHPAYGIGLISFTMGALLLAASCGHVSNRYLFNHEPTYVLNLHLGMRWEYWRISSWPCDKSARALDNVVIEVTEQIVPGKRRLTLDPIIDYGNEALLWLESTDDGDPRTLRIKNDSQWIVEMLSSGGMLKDDSTKLTMFRGLEIKPHYFTPTFFTNRISGQWIGLESMPGSGEYDLWGVTETDEHADSKIFKPATIPSTSKRDNETLIIGDVYRLDPTGGSRQADFSVCYLANSTVGLVDLTILKKDPRMHWHIIDPLIAFRVEDKYAHLVPWEWWALGHRRNRNKANIVVPSQRVEICGWSSSHWGWMIDTSEKMITVPAGEFPCFTVTRFGHGLQNRLEGKYLFREYWAPGIGLVARIDLRKDGYGIWVLADYSDESS